MLDGTQDGDELLLQCSDSDFGNANRKLRTRIDAEIEIRLVSCLFHAFIMYIKTKYIKATLKLAKKPNSNHSSMCVVSAVAVRAVASCNEPAVALYDFVVVVKRVGAAVKRDHTHKWAEASVAASAANELKSSRVQFSWDETRRVGFDLIAHATWHVVMWSKGHRLFPASFFLHPPFCPPFIMPTIGSYLIWANALHSCPIFHSLVTNILRRQQQ